VTTLIGLAVPPLTFILRRWADLADRYQSAVQRLAFIGVGILLSLIILDDPHGFLGGLSSTVPLAAAFVAFSAAVGWMTAAASTATGGTALRSRPSSAPAILAWPWRSR
jgi:hypothetical protein